MKIQSTLVGGITRLGESQPAPAVKQQYEVCDDPITSTRNWAHFKYEDTFDKLEQGKCVKCEPDETRRIAAALLKYLKRKNRTGVVRSTKAYPKDNLGRVWWLAKGQKHET